jgi:hypothetical protein
MRHPTRAGCKLTPTLILLGLLAACAGSPAPTASSPTTTPAPTITATATATTTSATLALATPTVSRATGTTPVTNVASPAATPSASSCGPGVALLGFSDGLDKARFGDTDVGGLSALAFDREREVYYALADNQGTTAARYYTLRLPLDGATPGTPIVEAVTTLRDEQGQPFTGRNLDGEGLALLPDGELLVSSETEPSIRRFALDGRLLDTLPVPARFAVKPDGEGTENQTFESLSLAPGANTLFTAVEGPLAADGFTGDLRARVRILRYDRAADGAFLPAAQHFYLAESVQGVADIVALSDTDLIVLERGFIPGLGNTVRAFTVSLVGATDLSDRPSLNASGLTPLKKTLLLDVGTCPPSGATHPARQPNPLLDNFEALALGPTLPDGRRTLLLLSDDNFADEQVTRIIVLAWRPGGE